MSIPGGGRCSYQWSRGKGMGLMSGPKEEGRLLRVVLGRLGSLLRGSRGEGGV